MEYLGSSISQNSAGSLSGIPRNP